MTVNEMIRRAILAERERCAKVCEQTDIECEYKWHHVDSEYVLACAAERIRSGVEPKSEGNQNV
jgi:hypothetical protein